MHRARKLSTVLGTTSPKSPMTILPAGSPPTSTSKKHLLFTFACSSTAPCSRQTDKIRLLMKLSTPARPRVGEPRVVVGKRGLASAAPRGRRGRRVARGAGLERRRRRSGVRPRGGGAPQPRERRRWRGGARAEGEHTAGLQAMAVGELLRRRLRLLGLSDSIRIGECSRWRGGRSDWGR